MSPTPSSWVRGHCLSVWDLWSPSGNTLLGGESWDSTRTSQQDLSGKSGLNISEHVFLRRRGWSGQEPRAGSLGLASLLRWQILKFSLQREPDTTQHISRLYPSISKRNAVTAPDPGKIHTSPIRYAGVLPQHFVYNAWKPNPAVIIGL